jgi:hypothetical protein
LEDYAERILALVAEQPDRTLDELVAALHKRRIPGSRNALWRFLDRHGITFKKNCGQPSNTAPTWRERGGVGFVSRAILIRRDWSSSMRPRSPLIWFVSDSGGVARVASD